MIPTVVVRSVRPYSAETMASDGNERGVSVGSGPMAAESSSPAKSRSADEIEAEIVAARSNLMQTVHQLEVAVKTTVNPKRLVAVQITKVRSFYVDEYGGLKPERVAVTVGVVVSVVVVRGVLKRAFRKK